MAAVGFRGICHRQCRIGYAAVDEQTLEASKRAGGRCNPPGEFGAVYVALERETAVAELRRNAARAGMPVEELLPRVLLHVRVQLTRVLDLTDADVRRSLGVGVAQLLAEDWTHCHAIARHARDAGYEAVRFPSAAGAGQNLAIFLDRLGAGSIVRVDAAEELVLGE